MLGGAAAGWCSTRSLCSHAHGLTGAAAADRAASGGGSSGEGWGRGGVGDGSPQGELRWGMTPSIFIFAYLKK